MIRLAADATAFETAIAAELSETDKGAVGRRVAVAKENSWTARLELMSSLIVEAQARRTDPDSCVASQAN